MLGLEDPDNHKFSRIAARNRIRSEFIPIDSDGVQLDRLAQSGVSLMHVSPASSFPLGSVMPIRRRLDLLSWLGQDSSRYLIEGDFDSELNSYGNPTTPIFGADPGERTIYLNSFSKTLVPSLRISYMVLPPALTVRYLATMTFYSRTVSGSDSTCSPGSSKTVISSGSSGCARGCCGSRTASRSNLEAQHTPETRSN